MIDFRALCEELHAAFNTYAVDMAHHDLLERARAALAEQPVGPTDEELNALWIEQYGYTGHSPAMSLLEFKDAARAVLARWGTPNLAQVRSSLGEVVEDDVDLYLEQ
jgi:hypothetical protein